jgi:molecular chaperone DnaJ
MENKDYYKILEVTSSSTQEDIKKAFRRLSKLHHPDIGGTEEKIKEINEAYSILGDPQKKSNYDTMKTHGNFGGYNYNQNGRTYPQGDKNFEDLINEMFGSGFTQGSRQYDPFKTRRDTQGFFEELDINLTVDVTLEHIYRNEKLNINYKRNVVCTKCDGTGSDLSDDGNDCLMCGQTGIFQGAKCRFCRGSGRIHTQLCAKCKGEKVCEKDEKIPVETLYSHKGERKYTVHNYGHFSKYYTDLGKKGSLFIKLIEKEHNLYKRGSNGDLQRKIDIDFKTAITGGKFKFTHLDGKEYEINIPAKIEDGQGLKMSNKGLINNPQHDLRGNLILNVNIIVDYNNLTIDQINKIKSL